MNNDWMIDHLAVLLDKYPRSANRTRCFTHILNLVAKCIMKQFDAPKKKRNGEAGDDDKDEDADDLATALANKLDKELEVKMDWIGSMICILI
jgi:hypothetical protein